MNIEALVTSLDCNHGVCPQTQGAITCTITGSIVAWYSPPSNSNPFATVTTSIHFGNTGFIATLVSNNIGLTINLSLLPLLIRKEHKSGVVIHIQQK